MTALPAAQDSWDAMLADLHEDPHMAVDVQVTTAVLAGHPCRMAWMTGDAALPLLETGFSATTRIGEIRAAELPDIEEGDTVSLLDASGQPGEVLRVDKADRPGPDRLLWRLWLVPAGQ